MASIFEKKNQFKDNLNTPLVNISNIFIVIIIVIIVIIIIIIMIIISVFTTEYHCVLKIYLPSIG